MTHDYTVFALKYACDLTCKEKDISPNYLYMIMPGLFYCFKNDDWVILPPSFIEKMAAEKDPIFQRIIKFLNVIHENMIKYGAWRRDKKLREATDKAVKAKVLDK